MIERIIWLAECERVPTKYCGLSPMVFFDVSGGGTSRIWREHPNISAKQALNSYSNPVDPTAITHLPCEQGPEFMFLLSFDSSCVWEWQSITARPWIFECLQWIYLSLADFVAKNGAALTASPCESARNNSRTTRQLRHIYLSTMSPSTAGPWMTEVALWGPLWTTSIIGPYFPVQRMATRGEPLNSARKRSSADPGRVSSKPSECICCYSIRHMKNYPNHEPVRTQKASHLHFRNPIVAKSGSYTI